MLYHLNELPDFIYCTFFSIFISACLSGMRVIRRIPSCIKNIWSRSQTYLHRDITVPGIEFTGAIRRVCAWQYLWCVHGSTRKDQRGLTAYFFLYSGQGEGQRRRDDRSLQGHAR